LRNRSLTQREQRRVDSLDSQLRSLCQKEAEERFEVFSPLFEAQGITVNMNNSVNIWLK